MSHGVRREPTGGMRTTEVSFASFIIYSFQLIFLAEIMFFSHNKSDGTVLLFVFSAKRTRSDLATGPYACEPSGYS